MSEKTPPNPLIQDDAPEEGLGKRVAERRNAKGLTHDGLAKLTKLLDRKGGTGISRTTIRGYEIGLYKPGTRELRLLSQALEVSPNWLIFGGEHESSQPGQVDGNAKSLPLTELQKFLTALVLLRKLDPSDRQIVYDVLHSFARHRMGETRYRADVIAMSEISGLMGDAWEDAKEEGGKWDTASMTKLMEAHGPYIRQTIQEQLGVDLDNLASPPAPPGSR